MFNRVLLMANCLVVSMLIAGCGAEKDENAKVAVLKQGHWHAFFLQGHILLHTF